MAMSAKRSKITQRDLFKANPELRKAYAAEATRKSRERKRKEKIVLTQRNSLLENDKLILKRRISALQIELRNLEDERNSPNVALILEHEALSKAVKKHRIIFDEIKSTIEDDINTDIVFKLSSSGLTACFEDILRLDGEILNSTGYPESDWQLFSPAFKIPTNRGMFNLNENFEILFKEETLSSGDRYLCFRFLLSGIAIQAPVLHESLWEFLQKGKAARSYQHILHSLCSPTSQYNIKTTRKSFACSDERPNRTFVTELETTSQGDELFLTAETIQACSTTQDTPLNKYFIIRNQLGQAFLRKKLVQERLNKQVTKDEERNLLESIIVSPSPENKDLSTLGFISKIRVNKDRIEEIELEHSTEHSFLMQVIKLFTDIETYLTNEHIKT